MAGPDIKVVILDTTTPTAVVIIILVVAEVVVADLVVLDTIVMQEEAEVVPADMVVQVVRELVDLVLIHRVQLAIVAEVVEVGLLEEVEVWEYMVKDLMVLQENIAGE